MPKKKHHIIDMWYDDTLDINKHGMKVFFYPHGNFGYSYRGNIYNENGKAIGDIATDDSVWLQEKFGIEWE